MAADGGYFIGVGAAALWNYIHFRIRLALAYGWMAGKRPSDILKFALALAGTTSFFALIVALFQPRYLGLFPGLLHPHLHL